MKFYGDSCGPDVEAAVCRIIHVHGSHVWCDYCPSPAIAIDVTMDSLADAISHLETHEAWTREWTRVSSSRPGEYSAYLGEMTNALLNDLNTYSQSRFQ